MYFTQVENLKQHQNNKNSKTGGLINLSWSKISDIKSKWVKGRYKQNSILKILNSKMSLKLDNLNTSSFDSDIRELLPCDDLPISSRQLHSDHTLPTKYKYKNISSKYEIKNCDIKDSNKGNNISDKNCIVAVQQLTHDNINNILKQNQVKSSDITALHQNRSLDSTLELAMTQSSTCSPNKSQSCRSCDIRTYQLEQTENHNKTKSGEEVQATLKFNVHEVSLSGFYSNISSSNYLSSKLTLCCDVPEETFEKCNRAVVFINQINTQSSVVVRQSQSEYVSDAATRITDSPRKSQLIKSSDVCQVEQAESHRVCKTENKKQLKAALSVTLRKKHMSDSHSNNFPITKPEETAEQCNNTVVVINKLNAQSSANIHQCHPSAVIGGTTNIRNCFVKLEKLDCYKEKLKPENPNLSKELQGNILSRYIVSNRNNMKTMTEKSKNLEKNELVCSAIVKHEKKIDSSLIETKSSINNNFLSLRERRLSSLSRRFSCETCKTPVQRNVLGTDFYLTEEINTSLNVNKKSSQVRLTRERRRNTLRVSNFHNIESNLNPEKNISLALKKVNEKRNRMHRSKQSLICRNTIPNIMCIDGTYDESSSDSCDISCISEQNSSSKLTLTPKHHKQVQNNQETPKHRYKPLKIEINKSPNSKYTSYEEKNTQLVGKLQTESKVVIKKADEVIRKTSNKRPAVGSEVDTSTAGRIKVPKKFKVEQKSPMHVSVDVDTSTDKVKGAKKNSLCKKTESSLQRTNVSSITNINRKEMTSFHLPEPHVCLQRLSFKNGKHYKHLILHFCN